MKNLRVVVVLVVLFVSLVVGLALPVTASPLQSPVPQPPAPIDPGTVPELPVFLDWLAGPAGYVAIGVFISMVLANWPWFEEQPSNYKRVFVIVITILLSALARVLLLVVPAEFWVQSAWLWEIVAGVILTWTASQANHLGLVQKRGATCCDG